MRRLVSAFGSSLRRLERASCSRGSRALFRSSHVTLSRDCAGAQRRWQLGACRGMASDATIEERVRRIPLERMRNFSVIAHIDHGKSTLCDALLELAGNISAQERAGTAQVLDSLEVERERGITVKAQTASIVWEHGGQDFLLNLIDTPGHVDFASEVRRALAACEGVLLLVDATQGVQAQTLANYQIAKDLNLDVLPVLTKTDLSHARVEDVAEELLTLFDGDSDTSAALADFDPDNLLTCSAKTGDGVEELLPAILKSIQPPKPPTSEHFRGLLFDSWFDTHRGVICLVHVASGTISKGQKISTYHGGQNYEVREVGMLLPRPTPTDALRTGQVGYVIAGIKKVKDAQLGDTLFHTKVQRDEIDPMPGFEHPKPMVFSGMFPESSADFDNLRAAVGKLMLSDSSVTMQDVSSDALGAGFRCGFLGLLHMEVFSQRLDQEFGAPVVVTAPSVPYAYTPRESATLAKTLSNDADGRIRFESASDFPDPAIVKEFFQPMVRTSILAPEAHIGPIMDLAKEHRAEMQEMTYLSATRVVFEFRMPLAEMVGSHFYNRLKQATSGYATFDYEPDGWDEANLALLEVRINGKPVDALSVVCEKSIAPQLGRQLALRLKNAIDRQNFEVVIQAALGSKIVASERIKPFRKDVLIKSGKVVGGGDISRKKKLLQKQKEGKKRGKMVGNVKLSQEALMSVVKTD